MKTRASRPLKEQKTSKFRTPKCKKDHQAMLIEVKTNTYYDVEVLLPKAIFIRIVNGCCKFNIIWLIK